MRSEDNWDGFRIEAQNKVTETLQVPPDCSRTGREIERTRLICLRFIYGNLYIYIYDII